MPNRRHATRNSLTEVSEKGTHMNSNAVPETQHVNGLSKSKSARGFSVTHDNSDSSISSLLHKKRFSEKRGSIADEVRYLKDRASQLIIHVPVENLKKIANTAGVNSLSRETQYFCGICTMHGPLRVYRGKSYSRFFWSTMVTLNFVLLIWQNAILFKEYFAKPTASQVFFILPEDGIPFPSLTVCSYNSVRKTYVKKLNESGDFSQQLLDYIKQSYVEVETFYANAKLSALEEGKLQYENYTSAPVHQNFSFESFYSESGFPCDEMLKICTFGGQRFNCCEYAEPILTDLGRCYLIQLSDSKNLTLQKQTQAGLNSGLLMVADFHTAELLESITSSEPQPFLSNGFENGFRYFIHGVDEISYLSHEGISVSPGFSVDTAVGPSKFLLLDDSEWGNCTGAWPKGYSSQRLYSAAKCRALCRARYFNERCGCSPFFYNIDGEYRVCSPYETYTCIYHKLSGANKRFLPPKCPECKMECERWVYHSYNSYGYGFSNDAVSWLYSQNGNWTPAHVRTNFVTMSIAYLDMSYTVYSQVQSTSLTQVLSNIGGNMGLFLGMSVLSCAEIIMYLAKMAWIMISRKRRQYMIFKKQEEEERERRLKETIDAVHRENSERDEQQPPRKLTTIDRFKRFGSHIAKRALRAPFHREFPDENMHEALEDDRRNRRAAFFNNFVSDRLYNSGLIDTFGRNNATVPGTRNNDVLELKIDLNDLCRHRSPSLPIPCQITTVPHAAMSEKRRRSPSDPLENSLSIQISSNNSVNHRNRSPIPDGMLHNNSNNKLTHFSDYYIEVPEQIAEVDEESIPASPLNLSQNAALKSEESEEDSKHLVCFMLPEDAFEESESDQEKPEFSTGTDDDDGSGDSTWNNDDAKRSPDKFVQIPDNPQTTAPLQTKENDSVTSSVVSGDYKGSRKRRTKSAPETSALCEDFAVNDRSGSIG